MKRLIVMAVTVFIGIMFCAPAYAQDAAAGQKVFQRERCGMCHTATRNSLSDVGSKLTADQIKEWIKTPAAAAKKGNVTMKPPMRSFEKLSEKDVNNLVAYLQTMKGAK